MANRKISDLTALTAPVTSDLLQIVDISEAAAADKNKKITYGTFLSSAPLGSAAAPTFAFSGYPSTGIYSPGADQLAITTAGTGRLFVDGSGNVGIGTGGTAPVSRLQVVGTATFGNGVGGRLQVATDSNLGYIDSLDNTSTNWQTLVERATQIQFHTNAAGTTPTQKATIDSSGRLLVGTTTWLLTDARNRLNVDSGSGTFVTGSFKNDAGSTAQVIETWNASTSGDAKFISFLTETSVVERGLIDYNRAAGLVRYNVTSDQRLKSAIQPATSAVELLSSIQVRSYIWTETGYIINYGFIAQELNQVLPDAVKVGDDGEEVQDTWAVDNSKLVPLLTKALQEAIARIETLETEVAALKGA